MPFYEPPLESLDARRGPAPRAKVPGFGRHIPGRTRQHVRPVRPGSHGAPARVALMPRGGPRIRHAAGLHVARRLKVGGWPPPLPVAPAELAAAELDEAELGDLDEEGLGKLKISGAFKKLGKSVKAAAKTVKGATKVAGGVIGFKKGLTEKQLKVAGKIRKGVAIAGGAAAALALAPAAIAGGKLIGGKLIGGAGKIIAGIKGVRKLTGAPAITASNLVGGGDGGGEAPAAPDAGAPEPSAPTAPETGPTVLTDESGAPAGLSIPRASSDGSGTMRGEMIVTPRGVGSAPIQAERAESGLIETPGADVPADAPKPGLSTGAKVGIGVGIALVLALALRGKGTRKA